MARFCYLVAIGVFIFSTRILAYRVGECDGVIGDKGLVPPIGTMRALVVIFALPSDQAIWESRRTPNIPNDYDNRSWPDMPLWMCDSLIVPVQELPNFQTTVETDKYKRSISNFLHRESYNHTTGQTQHILVGDVNPRPVNPANTGNFFLSEAEANAEYGPNWRSQLPSGYDCRIIVTPYAGSSGGGVDTYIGYFPDARHINDILSTLVWAIAHEYGHCMGLEDKYDAGYKWNAYARSGVTGIYSAMHIIINQSDQPIHTPPYSLRDKMPGLAGAENIATLGWVTPQEITSTQYNLEVRDFYTAGDCYKIPFSNPTHPDEEYFLVVNHQKENHWEEEYRGTGVLVWHINEGFQYNFWGPGYSPTNPYIFSEKKKCEDVECAIGLYDTGGVWPGVRTPSPEQGWDPIDNFCDEVVVPDYITFNSDHYGRWGDFADFFPLGNKNAFAHLANPSSNAYNVNQESLFTYGAGGICEVK